MAYTRRNTTDGVTVMNKDLYDNLQDGIEERGITPEMFGAVGDGVHDDTEAIQKALNSGYKVYLLSKTYLISKTLIIPNQGGILGFGFESVIKCSKSFTGKEAILIDSVLNTELKNFSLIGSSVYDYSQNIFTYRDSLNGIHCSSTTSHISVCRLRNLNISMFGKCGIVVDPVTYEIIADILVVKLCGQAGIWNRGTDGLWSNVHIGSCGHYSNDYPSYGCQLEGGNNNYSNFKIYLCKTGGLFLENGTTNNNYLNFNIQENDGYGLFFNGGVKNCQLSNFCIDSCKNGINLYKADKNYIQAVITSNLSTIKTLNWLVAYECVGKVYLDILTSVEKKNTDGVNIVYLKEGE